MFIVDAHLDLAYNAQQLGRNLLVPAASQPPDEEGTPSVSLPDLRAGCVGLTCATIFCEPAGRPGSNGYRTPDEAHAQALAQLQWYHTQIRTGQLELVTDASQLPSADSTPAKTKILVLLEGADPLRNAADVAEFHAAGLRIVGLAWKRTRAAGGTGEPGPLTPEGITLVRELDRYGIIHDVSHLAEASFWQLLDLSGGPMIASHSNCRALIPTDRQLSDDMIRALVRRDGVIGINFFDKFLVPPGQTRRASLADVVRQIRHVCDLAGDARHVGIGSDMDGGFGAEQLPVELKTSADLGRLADEMNHAGFADEAVRDILAGNWLRFFREALVEMR